MAFKWEEDVKTGNTIMDSEHKMLMDALNDLMKAKEQGKSQAEIDRTMDFLSDYLEHHFSNEEDMWARYGYPESEKHKAEHLKFKELFHQFRDEFGKGATVEHLGKMHNGLAQWLYGHFKEADQHVADHIDSKEE